jgi:histidine triad (HIT) family protein
MASIFTRIINGEIPCYKIAENEEFIAFLDIAPMVKGHTLVVPKVEIDYIFDQDDATLAGILPFSKRVAKAIEAVVPCGRVCVAVIGLDVPHTHIHLVPTNRMSDFNFKNKFPMTAEEMKALAADIAAKFE